MLVSEFMLQQTQVATVIPYFERFVTVLPDVAALAAAEEDVVLRLWQGLGYYSRARRLQAAARACVDRHGGNVPADVESLLDLPGVGRYTAGAIASIAFDVPAPILDGNVVRVLVRLHGIRDDPTTPTVQRQLWTLAAEAVDPDAPGDFNSAMMELGATVCVPRSPRCLTCPVSRWCAARAGGFQDEVPPQKKAKEVALERRDVWRVRDAEGRYVVEQRPTTGRWAGLWQFPTRPTGEAPPLLLKNTVPLGEVTHGLTHRRYVFRAFDATLAGDLPAAMRLATTTELDSLAMSKPQLKIRQMPH